MTSTSKIIREQFKQKEKYVYLILIVQIIAWIFSLLLALFNKNQSGEYMSIMDSSKDFTTIVYRSVLETTIFADLAYCVLSSWRNEKINNSQTWQLIPSSSGKLWINNVVSSLLTCAYIFVIQNILLAFVALATKQSINQPLMDLGLWGNKYFGLDKTIERILFLILVVVFIYVFVSFVNFCTKAIVDILPFEETIWIKLFVMALLTIVAVYFGSIILGRTAGYVETHFARINARYSFIDDPMWIDNLELFIADLVLIILNIILSNKYIESK